MGQTYLWHCSSPCIIYRQNYESAYIIYSKRFFHITNLYWRKIAAFFGLF